MKVYGKERYLRLISFAVVCGFLWAILVSLVWWQHGRMIEKIALEAQQLALLDMSMVDKVELAHVGRRILIDVMLVGDESVWVLHQRRGDMTGWRLVMPTTEGFWLDKGVFAPQHDKLEPTFPTIEERFTGVGVIRAMPAVTGWLTSPVETVNARVWNRLDGERMGGVYVSLETEAVVGLPASRHRNYRNTWVVCAVILPFLFLLYVMRLRRSGG